MLYAASVKVTFKNKVRRIDVIVESENKEAAGEKAIKQARSLYYPGKRSLYEIMGMINEVEALESVQNKMENPVPENPDTEDE